MAESGGFGVNSKAVNANLYKGTLLKVVVKEKKI